MTITQRIQMKYGSITEFAEEAGINRGTLGVVLTGAKKTTKCVNALIEYGFINSIQDLPKSPNRKRWVRPMTLKERIRKKYKSLKAYSKHSGVHATTISYMLKGGTETPVGITALIEDGFISSVEDLRKTLAMEKHQPKTVSERIMEDWGSIAEFGKLNNINPKSLTMLLSGCTKSRKCLDALINHGYVDGYEDLWKTTLE